MNNTVGIILMTLLAIAYVGFMVVVQTYKPIEYSKKISAMRSIWQWILLPLSALFLIWKAYFH